MTTTKAQAQAQLDLARAQLGNAPGAVERASNALVLEPPRALDRKRSQLGYDALQELDQQVQVEVSGTATSVVTTVETKVKFDVGFVDAREQRYSAYTVPLFTCGFALLSVGQLSTGEQAPAPLVSAVVRAWTERPGPVIIGAEIAMSAALPGINSQEEIDFSGYLHMCFQGFGALEENEPDLDA